MALWLKGFLGNLSTITNCSLKLSQIPVFYAVHLSLFGIACVQQRAIRALGAGCDKKRLIEIWWNFYDAPAQRRHPGLDGKCRDNFWLFGARVDSCGYGMVDVYSLCMPLYRPLPLSEASIPLSQLSILHIPPISTKFKNFSYFRRIYTFPHSFVQYIRLWLNLRFFASPYFDHDAFMHYDLHALDASVDLCSFSLTPQLSGLTCFLCSALRHSPGLRHNWPLHQYNC